MEKKTNKNMKIVALTICVIVCRIISLIAWTWRRKARVNARSQLFRVRELTAWFWIARKIKRLVWLAICASKIMENGSRFDFVSSSLSQI